MVAFAAEGQDPWATGLLCGERWGLYREDQQSQRVTKCQPDGRTNASCQAT